MFILKEWGLFVFTRIRRILLKKNIDFAIFNIESGITVFMFTNFRESFKT